MKNLTKEEFRTYCLLFAADNDFNITKQEIIAIGAKIEPIDFVRVYNIIETQDEMERIETINAHKTQYIKNEEDKRLFFNEMKGVFFTDSAFDSVEKSVFSMLNKVL